MNSMKILGKISYALFIVVLIGVAGLFLASFLPIPRNYQVKIVRSGSMEPAIKTGAIVIVKPAPSYNVGDVVTFGEDTKMQIPTTHRIFEVLDKGGKISFLTKGDANEEEDPTEEPLSKVIGKDAVAVPFAGYILDFARKPVGFVLLVGLPAGIVILDEATRIFEEIALMRRRRKERGKISEMEV